MIYIALSIIGFIGKSFLFKQLLAIYNKSQLHQLMCALFCLLISGALFELSLYYFADDIDSPLANKCLIGFYFCLFYIAGLLPLIALATSNTQIPHWLLYTFLSVISAVTVLLLFSRSIIADIEFVASTASITRVAGPYYFIFQTVVILCLLSTLLILIKRSFASNYFVRVRSRNLCIAFIPVFSFSVFIVAAMAMGAKFNAVGILSFCSLIYLSAMIHNIQPKKQPDYLVFMPFTKKNKILANTLNQLVYIEVGGNNKNLDEQLIDYYLSQPGLKQKEIAKLLDISEATLSRRKQQLKKAETDEQTYAP